MVRTLSLTIILATLLTAFSVSQASVSNKSKILPFKVWKQKKVDEAKSVVSELKRQSKKFGQVKSEGNLDEKEEVQQKLSQASLNLGLARELSANDYFLLYVSPQFKGSGEALIQAAKTLTPKDMADILLAYQQQLQGGNPYNGPDTPSSNETPAPQEKTASAP